MLAEMQGLPSESTCVPEAEPDKLDFKIHKPGIQHVVGEPEIQKLEKSGRKVAEF